MDKPTGDGVVLRSLNVDFDGGRLDGGTGESVEATKKWAARHGLKRMPLEHNSQHALVTCREQITNSTVSLHLLPDPLSKVKKGLLEMLLKLSGSRHRLQGWCHRQHPSPTRICHDMER